MSYKAKEKNIIVLEDFSYEAPKTKDFVEMLKNFELENKRVLVVLNDIDKNVYLSSRNVQKTKVIKASDINTYDILNASKILMAKSSIEEIEKIHSVTKK